ncbi:MAG: hypothetical protein KKB13_10340 [Chloroflexi bacterium]|nr:hypothetical protein [Chloroflexota bacterium]MBU1623384.1 hypothetical protein [Nanoarchaeota archaeon]
MSFAQTHKVVLCYQGAANAVACDVVSMKHFAKGTFLVTHTGANDTDLVLSLYEATDVAAGTNAAVTTACPVWLDADAGTTSDVVALGTAAYTKTIDPATENGVVWMIEVDPSILSSGYDCVYLSDSGGHGSNVCTILFIGEPRYAGATLPAAITD